MKKTQLTLLALAAAAALAITGCSGGSGGSTSSGGETSSQSGSSTPTGDEISTKVDPALTKLLPKKITDAGKINIAVDIPAPPMAYYDKDNRAVGFDPELGRLLGQKLGIDVSINKQPFDSVIPSLQAGKNDIIMSGMNDTVEREKTLSFIDYSHGGFAVAVRKGNPDKITTQQDLCGKNVSVQKATVQVELLNNMNCGIKLQELPMDLDAQTALRAGKSQAYVADAVVVEYVVASTGDGKTFDIVRDPKNPAGFNPVYSGIGVLKGDTEMVTAIQKAFQALIDEGTYQKVLDRNKIGAYAVKSAEVNQASKAS